MAREGRGGEGWGGRANDMLKLYIGSTNWIINLGNIAKNWDSRQELGGQ